MAHGRRAARLVLLAALLLPALRLAPLAWGHVLADEELRFSGLGYLPSDFVSYAGLMEQARVEGRFPLRNDYTLESSAHRYLLGFHYAVGRLAAALGTGVPAAWAIAQYALGAAFLLGAWRLLRTWLRPGRERLVAFALVAFSGGLEWVAWALLPWCPPRVAAALEQITAPQYGWNTFEALYNPVWTAAHLVWIALLGCLLRSAGGRGAVWLAPAVLLVPLLYVVHPYTAIGAACALAATSVLLLPDALRRAGAGRRQLGCVAAVGAAFAVPLLLSRWQREDATFRALSDAALASDAAVAFPFWPLTYGLLLPLAAVGLRELHREGGFPARLAAGWLLGIAVAAHLPFLSPFRYLALLHLPLCIAAAKGLAALARGAPPWLRGRAALAGLALALGATNAWELGASLHRLRSGARETPLSPSLFLPRADYEAMEALRPRERAPALASLPTGAYLPWLAHKPVFVGHWFLTLDAPVKQAQVERFFDARTPLAWKRALLRRHGIRYVFQGQSERSLGAVDPGLPLEVVIAVDGVRVFEVLPER
jgi:hypothetical protein